MFNILIERPRKMLKYPEMIENLEKNIQNPEKY